jgi:hypothetical protein
MALIVSGLLIGAYLTVALYFLRFWRDTRDRLFLLFACAFALLALQRFGLTLVASHSVYETWLYLLRIFGFGMILFAIVDKNRK